MKDGVHLLVLHVVVKVNAAVQGTVQMRPRRMLLTASSSSRITAAVIVLKTCEFHEMLAIPRP